MSGIKRLIEEAAVGTDINAPVPAAEDVKLWLPLEILVEQRKEVAMDVMYKGELHLRKASVQMCSPDYKGSFLPRGF